MAIVVVVSVGAAARDVAGAAVRRAPPLSALITVGMAICGNSAILALAPIVRRPHRETAYAVSTITIFGLIGVLRAAGPRRGSSGCRTPAFGTWAGLAVNDTAQVVATGLCLLGAGGRRGHGRQADAQPRDPAGAARRDLAEVRARDAERQAEAVAGSTLRLVARAVPWFVVGFVVFAALALAGLLDVALPTGGTLADLCSTLADLLILVALAGVGIATDIRAMLGVGRRPVPPRGRDVGRHGLLGLGSRRSSRGPR